MKRTDIHRPSAIIVDEYQYVGVEHIKIESLGDAMHQTYMREQIRAHMATTGGTYSRHTHGGNCHVCGNANAIYTILFYHPLTNVYVRLGKDCAEKLEYSESEFNAFVSAHKHYTELKAGKRKAQGFLEEKGIGRAWAIREEYLNTPSAHSQIEGEMTPTQVAAVRKAFQDEKEASTICDMINKLIKYGDMSDKAVAYIKVMIARIDRRPEIEAQRAAERAAAKDCPTGRVTVTGKIVSVKVVEGFYGTQIKMVLKSDEGFVVYATVPSSIFEPKKDMKITIKATLTPSDDDPKFGFGKRPTLVSVEEPVSIPSVPVGIESVAQ
jgi:hypothetical protein